MSGSADAAAKEQRLLKASIKAVALMGVVTVTFGLWSGSSAITFDGFYSFADVGMTWLALIITRLISRGDDERFQYGYWHLEPLLGLVNGAVLTMTCAYAFVTGLVSLLSGGHEIAFGPGALFSAVMATLGLGMYVYISRSAADLRSQFLQIDARGWLMGAALSASLCVSFLVASRLKDSSAAHLVPLVDPAVLAIVSLALLPFPIRTLWRAGRDILQIAPPELSAQVQAAAQTVADRHGFGETQSHIARSGRQLFIEIGLVAPPGAPAKSFEELDDIRTEILAALDDLGPRCWLTVDFTADRRWI